MFGTQGVVEQTCTPFGDGLFHSDHRGLFVDINLGTILSDAVSAVSTLDTPATRLLSSKPLVDLVPVQLDSHQHHLADLVAVQWANAVAALTPVPWLLPGSAGDTVAPVPWSLPGACCAAPPIP